MPSLTWKVLAVATVTGLLILVGAWWQGASLFGLLPERDRQVVSATVTAPAECHDRNAVETVRFEVSTGAYNGKLSGCGHNKDEQIRVEVPRDLATVEAPVDVRLAATAPGTHDPRRPVGMGLLLLSCVAGGTYAYLLVRGPRFILA